MSKKRTSPGLLLAVAVFVTGGLLWSSPSLPAPPSLAEAAKQFHFSSYLSHERGDPAQVASAYRSFRTQLDPSSLALSERNDIFHKLCSVSLGKTPCQNFPTTCAIGKDDDLPYEVYLDEPSSDTTCSRKITGSLPVTLDQLDLIVSFAHTFKLQWQENSNLWDVIWIVAPAEQVAPLYDALEEAGVLHDVFRIISQDVILQERSTDPGYKGWHLQQDLKVAMAWASRTNYLLNLDADIMVGKPLTYENLFTQEGKAITVSAVAHTHWSWQHGNLQNTCKEVQIDCSGINKQTTIIGFTPIPFYVPAMFSLAKYLSEREQQPWLEYLISIRTRPQPGIWTEYSLYFVYSRWRGFYHNYHSEISKTRYTTRLDPKRPEHLAKFYSQPLSDRQLFLDVSDHDIPDTKQWRDVIVETVDPYREAL